MRRCRLPWLALFAAWMTVLSVAGAVARAAGAGSWVGSWASSQQIPEPRNALPGAALRDATLRQIVHLTVGGQLRVRLSNAFGTNADREAINAWIRQPGHFDAVVDFDRVVRDPRHPDRLLPAYDSGDHLHPSPAGYRAMAAAIPLALFAGHARTVR